MQDGYDLSPGGILSVLGEPHHDFDAYPSTSSDDISPR